MNKEKRQKKHRRGGTTIVMIGIIMAMMLFLLVFLETQTIYDCQYHVQASAQRAVNMTVEDAMDDEWRKDGYNYMDVDAAKRKLISNLRDCLNLNTANTSTDAEGRELYKCEFENIKYSSGQDPSHPQAGIELDMTITYYSDVGKHFNVPTITWTNKLKSSNFRTDDDLRAGH